MIYETYWIQNDLQQTLAVVENQPGIGQETRLRTAMEFGTGVLSFGDPRGVVITAHNPVVTLADRVGILEAEVACLLTQIVPITQNS
jgi:hypothetical protein